MSSVGTAKCVRFIMSHWFCACWQKKSAIFSIILVWTAIHRFLFVSRWILQKVAPTVSVRLIHAYKNCIVRWIRKNKDINEKCVINVWDKQKEYKPWEVSYLIDVLQLSETCFFATKSTFSPTKGEWVFTTQMAICYEVKFSRLMLKTWKKKTSSQQVKCTIPCIWIDRNEWIWSSQFSSSISTSTGL